ncbi:MAG TPA: VPDSG-CTERM sorting domain-containing protein [Verrucomicrobiota bacterium]|jgi:hypothetical protein|nr:VPDSG-CTERM sorting domain-containing protein [Verrucomicrobiota bacterium]HOH41063.1 VPDSG-CTERM sorting domain-containing protein [Verrucomicrobiota bacterium]
MKSNIVKYFAVAVAAFGLAISAHAVKITGEINMAGSVTLDSSWLGTANGVTGFGPVVVGVAPTGDFAGTAGASVSWSTFSWNPPSTPVIPLWTFTSGPLTYSFDLLSLSVAQQDNSFLNLIGWGTLKITGFEDTVGTWSFTIPNAGGGRHANFDFTFANSQNAVVPDGGMTAMLLGAALSGLALLRRKLA